MPDARSQKGRSSGSGVACDCRPPAEHCVAAARAPGALDRIALQTQGSFFRTVGYGSVKQLLQCAPGPRRSNSSLPLAPQGRSRRVADTDAENPAWRRRAHFSCIHDEAAARRHLRKTEGPDVGPDILPRHPLQNLSPQCIADRSNILLAVVRLACHRLKEFSLEEVPSPRRERPSCPMIRRTTRRRPHALLELRASVQLYAAARRDQGAGSC